MTEDVPATLRPPVPLALAKAVESVPAEAALPGGSLYEPKWDGFRLCALVRPDGVSLWSRQGKDLTRYSVGVQCYRTAVLPVESAVISPLQLSRTQVFGAGR